ncbi:MAG: hypothetical protein PHE84_06725 [bacterium]|nr:hypothetical protein [bacterium]
MRIAEWKKNRVPGFKGKSREKIESKVAAAFRLRRKKIGFEGPRGNVGQGFNLAEICGVKTKQ